MGSTTFKLSSEIALNMDQPGRLNAVRHYIKTRKKKLVKNNLSQSSKPHVFPYQVSARSTHLTILSQITSN